MTVCPGCTNTWTGLAVCHCSRCHVSFSSITAFDLHQVRNKTKCLDPATSPKFEELRSGVWGQPGDALSRPHSSTQRA